MDDIHIGALFRAARLKRDWRQADVGEKAGVSRQAVSRIECGRITSLPRLRRVAAVLEISLDLTARWRGGEGVRLLSSRHSALAESVTRDFLELGWEIRPEVSFAVYGERGIIDLVAWHPGRRVLLVIELKTELVDIGEMLGTLDRKRRLAPQVARSLGWEPASISVALIVAERAMNRKRMATHVRTIRAALPARGHAFRTWLKDPAKPVAAAVLWANSTGVSTIRDWAPTRRVRRRKIRRQLPAEAAAERGAASGARPAAVIPAGSAPGRRLESDSAQAVGNSRVGAARAAGGAEAGRAEAGPGPGPEAAATAPSTRATR